jgi:hypothetical protein
MTAVKLNPTTQNNNGSSSSSYHHHHHHLFSDHELARLLHASIAPLQQKIK